MTALVPGLHCLILAPHCTVQPDYQRYVGTICVTVEMRPHVIVPGVMMWEVAAYDGSHIDVRPEYLIPLPPDSEMRKLFSEHGEPRVWTADEILERMRAAQEQIYRAAGVPR